MNVHAPIAPPLAGYREDLARWAAEQARLLREGRFDLLDIENVAEEIDSVGDSQRWAIRSQFAVAVEHLLKLRHSRLKQPRKVWRRSVLNARRSIERMLDDNPSLRRELPNLFVKGSEAGADEAIKALLEYGDIREREGARIEADEVTLAQALHDELPYEDSADE